MSAATTLRQLLVESSHSFGARARARRWAQVVDVFPDLQSMSVLDLGGTPDFWQRSPVQPALVVCVNPEASPSEDPRIEVVRADACDVPAELRSRRFDLVFSNSTIEHVGNDGRRHQFAATVHSVAGAHWVQTPYRFFPVEPHWLFPGFQFLPLSVRALLDRRWPLTHTRSTDRASARAAVSATELLGLRSFQRYFPDSEIQWEHMFGLRKSMIAVRRTDPS